MAGDHYIGLMSGTSMDAVDAVLLSITGERLQTLAHHATPIDNALKRNLQRLCQPGEDGLDLFGASDNAIARLFANTALQLLEREGLSPSAITAIGSHGQTVRHRPPAAGACGFTLQIGDPSTIATLTGITTVADFRRKDMALGGQGAPLVPAFHRAAFQHRSRGRAIVNIGGIANITWLPPADSADNVTGFDTGPGNGLMDAWIRHHRGDAFDRDGTWAASGTPSPELLEHLLQDPYIQQPSPKSTGPEHFNLSWLRQSLEVTGALPPETVQATLCAYTAATIVRGIEQLPGRAEEILLCGGGVHNRHLMAQLSSLLPNTAIATTASQGVDPGHVEAAAFAWLAHRTLAHLPGNLASVTGAERDAILGGVYWP